MKILFRSLSAVIILLAFSLNVNAQVSATADASATIITPIAISVTTNMDFGNVAASGTAGTVILATDGSRSVTGGVTLPATTGSPTQAVFSVTGESGFTYSITLPGTVTLDDGLGNTMDVDTFTSNPSGSGTLTGGSETLNVGGTLNVGINQTAGTYTNNTDLTVTVNYN